MSLILTAQHDLRPSQRMTLRFGQSARVGRSPLVEFCLPEDDRLAAEHFTIHYGRPTRILASSCETSLMVNGEACQALPTLSSGRIRFLAGQTTFTVEFLGEQSTAVQGQLLAPPVATPPEKKTDVGLLCCYAEEMQFSPPATALIEPTDLLVDYARRLILSNLNEDLVRLIVRHLVPNAALAWALQYPVVQRPDWQWKDSGVFEDDLQHAIASWIDDPSEEHRLDVASHRQQASAGFQRYIVQAIGYTGGSLAPPGQPLIKPPRHLASVATLAAITLQRQGRKLDDPRSLPWMRMGLLQIKPTLTTKEYSDASRSPSR